MGDKIRHLRAIEAFDRVARCASVSRAAESFHVTHSAVSRQIRQLESSLGVSLFERRPKGVQLTVAGEQLYESTRQAFAALNHGIAGVRRRYNDRSLRLSLPNAVASKWLVPQLPEFEKRYPDIALFLDTDDRLADFENPELDVALRFAATVDADLHSEKISEEALIVVAASKLVGYQDKALTAEAIVGFPLLHDGYHDGWKRWAAQVGIAPSRICSNGIQYVDSGVLLEAAIAGQGVALARQLLVEDDIRAGRLLRLDPISVNLDQSLYFVCRPGDKDRPAISALKHWLTNDP